MVKSERVMIKAQDWKRRIRDDFLLYYSWTRYSYRSIDEVACCK